MDGKDSQNKEEKDDFNDKWTAFVSKSEEKIPGLTISYKELAEGIS